MYKKLPEIINASEASDSLWQEIVNLNEVAVRARYPASLLNNTALRRSIGIDSWEQYADAHRDPNILVGDGLRPNQTFRDPLITTRRLLQTDGTTGELRSVVLTADNTSGAHEIIREAKMHMPSKRWAWIGWVASHPDDKDYSIDGALHEVLYSRYAKQPWSAYAYPLEAAGAMLGRLGMKPDNPDWMATDLSELPADQPIPTERFTSQFRGSNTALLPID